MSDLASHPPILTRYPTPLRAAKAASAATVLRDRPSASNSPFSEMMFLNFMTGILSWNTLTVRGAGSAPPIGKEGTDAVRHIFDVRAAKPRKQADPECPLGNDVGVGQVTGDAIFLAAHVGLAGKIAAEQEPRANLHRVEILRELLAREVDARPYRQREAKPGRIAIWGSFGEDEEVLKLLERVDQQFEVAAPRLDEAFQMVKLGETDCRLHVGDLQIIADMAVGVFMVISGRKIAKLAAKALAASIVLARCAPAVAAPVAHRFNDALQSRLVGEHGPAFSHGDVMGGVEAQCSDVAEGADVLAVVCCAKRVATILDDPKVVLLRNSHDFAEVERVPQRMSDHDRVRLVADRGLDQVGLDVVSGDIDIHEYRH